MAVDQDTFMKLATKWRNQQSFFADEYVQEPGTLIVLYQGRVAVLDLITQHGKFRRP